MTPTVLLTIAGSDSGGGAGLQADLATFAAHGVHGACALTAVTAQNTTGVYGVVRLDPTFVVQQVTTVCEDLDVRAVKTGMLASSDTVAAVAALAARGMLPHLVVDPVLVSSTGHLLMDEGGVGAYRDQLLAHADVATPNLREAAVLTGRAPDALRSLEDMVAAAHEIRSLGAATVVVKGGHLGTAVSPDVVDGPGGLTVLEGTRIATSNDHGTGCSLSAAIAVGLAGGLDALGAIRAAKAYVALGLAGAAGWEMGSGHGPIDHFGWQPAGPGAPAR
ncbi:MAG TPA: bifunctional hydroxymethylpyrimidine kinase/phosphomethylpyrimidine kinase [Acidimicrobiales bacterium]